MAGTLTDTSDSERLAREHEVKIFWEKNGRIYVDEEVFEQCYGMIKRCLDVYTLVYYLEEHGLISSPAEMDESLFSSWAEMKKSLRTLANSWGEYGFFLLYMCIKESIDENPLHRRIVWELEDEARRLNKQPPWHTKGSDSRQKTSSSAVEPSQMVYSGGSHPIVVPPTGPYHPTPNPLPSAAEDVDPVGGDVGILPGITEEKVKSSSPKEADSLVAGLHGLKVKGAEGSEMVTAQGDVPDVETLPGLTEVQNFSERNLTEEESDALVEQYSHWLFTPNVVSLSYCSERKGTGTTGRKVLRVGVMKIMPWEQATKSDAGMQPCIKFNAPTGETVKVAVCQVLEGPIVPLGAPYEGGSHLKSEAVGVEGCAAVTVSFRGIPYCLLSNAHVLTGFDRENVAKVVYIRSNSKENWVELGTVSGQVEVNTYPDLHPPDVQWAKQDLAWCEVSAKSNIVRPNEIKEIGKVTDTLRAPQSGEKVGIYGGKSRLIYWDDPDDTIQVCVADGKAIVKLEFECGQELRYAFFKEVYRIDEELYLFPGDSGSAVVGCRDNALIGLVFSVGQKSKATYFCRVVD